MEYNESNNQGRMIFMKQFQAGYGRVDITPKAFGAPLGGWGQSEKRSHTTVLNSICASCVAVTGTNGETILLMSVDLLNSYHHDAIRKEIEKELGVPYKNILWAATHTHSAPDVYHEKNADFVAGLPAQAVEAAKQALADRGPAGICIGRTEIKGFNYIRHYIMNDGTYAGANFGKFTSGIKCFTSENDESVQIVRFTRRDADKKDIIMVNAQGHPLLTSNLVDSDLSSDVVGAARRQVEEQTGAHFICFVGASGDVNMGTHLPRGDAQNKEDYQAFGKLLCDGVIAALDHLEPIAGGAVHACQQTYMGQINRQMEDRLEDAYRIRELYDRTDRDTGNVLARQLGFSSVFHANGVIDRSKIQENERPITLTAFSFGDICFAAGPYEMFSAHGMRIKKESPYTMTFVTGCSNGAVGYLPTEFAFQFGCYESHTTKFTGDTGTKCAETLISMLKTMGTA